MKSGISSLQRNYFYLTMQLSLMQPCEAGCCAKSRNTCEKSVCFGGVSPPPSLARKYKNGMALLWWTFHRSTENDRGSSWYVCCARFLLCLNILSTPRPNQTNLFISAFKGTTSNVLVFFSPSDTNWVFVSTTIVLEDFQRRIRNLNQLRCPSFFLLTVPFITVSPWKRAHGTLYSWLHCKLQNLSIARCTSQLSQRIFFHWLAVIIPLFSVHRCQIYCDLILL